MSVRREIEDHIAQGRKIQAIKVLREATGWGLRDSKQAVDYFSANQQWEVRTLHLLQPEGDTQPSPSPATTNPGVAEIEALVKSGLVINAIKKFREMTQLGLRESKDAVDSYRENNTWRASDLQRLTGEVTWVESTSQAFQTPEQKAIEQFLRKQKKIQAIKVYRDVTGFGLAQAKGDVEAFMASGKWPPGVFAAVPANPTPEPAPGPAETPQPTPAPASWQQQISLPSSQQAPLKQVLESYLGKAVQLDIAVEAKRSIFEGFLCVCPDGVFFLIDRFGDLRVDQAYYYSEIGEVTVQQSYNGTELLIQVGFLPESFLDIPSVEKVAEFIRQLQQ